MMWLIIVPLLVLAFRFLLLLLVDQKANVGELARAMVMVPVDIVLVGTALLTGALALGNPSGEAAAGVLLCFVLAAILSAVLWRRSEAALLKRKTWPILALTFPNFVGSAAMLCWAMMLLNSVTH